MSSGKKVGLVKKISVSPKDRTALTWDDSALEPTYPVLAWWLLVLDFRMNSTRFVVSGLS